MKNKIAALIPWIKSKFLQVLVLFKKYPKSIILCLAVIVGATFYLSSGEESVSITTQSVAVVRKNLTTSVSGSGTISPTNTVDIKVKGQGDIRAISVKAGQTVKQGATLVSLDASDAYQELSTAQVNLETAELELEKIKQPAETLDLLRIKNQIATAKQKIIDQDVAVANAYKTFLNTSLTAYPETQSSSVSAPVISGSYMGGNEGEIKVISYLSGDGVRFTASGLATGEGLASLSTPQPIGTSGLYILFSSLDAQPSWIIPVPNKRSSSYLSAKTTYDNVLITKDKTIAEQERTLAELNEQLKDLEDGADTLDIRAKELIVAQRKNDVSEAYKKVSDYLARAPFDGVVASLVAEVGDSVTQSTVLGTIITNKKIAEISLNEADISRVTVGQKVVLTFDALSEVTIDGVIAEIDTIGTNSQGVVTYTVKVVFDEKETRIKPGMTVTADIVLEQKENTLVVPNEAIKTVKGKKIVSVGRGDTTQQTEITIGIVTDTETEVLTGLKEGDTVTVTRRTSQAATSATPSLLGAPRQGATARGI